MILRRKRRLRDVARAGVLEKLEFRQVSADVVRSPGPLGFSRREIVAFAVGACALAVLMTAAGAFNTDQFGVAHRFGLWLIVALLTVGQALVLDSLLSSRIPRAGAALAAVAGVIALMTFELHALKFTPLLPYDPDPLLAFAVFLAPPIGAIAGVVVMLRILTGPASAPAAPPAALGFQPRIAGYLPAPSAPASPADRVLRLRAHDHYLEVVTAEGRKFVRGRMGDALRALSGRAGVQPHRSWWVARVEIASIRREGRDYVLVTRDGAEIPVARSRVAALRAACVI